MTTAVFSFHRMRELCLAGDPHGWRGFIRQYAALARHLGQHYFPELPIREFVCEVFREARERDAALLRDFSGTSEGEFLFLLRPFVLNLGRRRRSGPASHFTPEEFWVLLQQFPPLQREMIVLSFRRYTPEEISHILRFEPDTVRKVVEQVVTKARAQPGASFRADLLALDHDALFAQIEQQRGDNCIADKTYVRIVDGQVTWGDKEKLDFHIDSCLYCLARFAEYRELFYFLQKLPPIEAAFASDIDSALGLPAEEAQKPRGLARWFSLLGRRARRASR